MYCTIIKLTGTITILVLTSTLEPMGLQIAKGKKIKLRDSGGETVEEYSKWMECVINQPSNSYILGGLLVKGIIYQFTVFSYRSYTQQAKGRGEYALFVK